MAEKPAPAAAETIPPGGSSGSKGIEGDSFSITTPGKAGMNRLGTQLFGAVAYSKEAGGPGRVRAVTLYAPDGTDPGIAANTGTIYVGPNGSTGFPLGPGGVLTLEKVDPALIGIDDRGTKGQLFIAYGGKDTE